MKARAHGLLAQAVWLGAAVGGHYLDGTTVDGHHLTVTLGPVIVVGGALQATGWGLWNDMDCQGTAARSVGWLTRIPAHLIATVSGGHRGATHTVLACVALAGLANVAVALGSGGTFTVLAIGYAWALAAICAADRPGRRLSRIARVVVALALAALTTTLDPHPYWLGGAVLVGGLAHLFGDLLTTDRWPLLAPFTRREFGGWRVIRPAPKGQRVTLTEWLIEVGLALAAIGAYALFATAWSVVPS